MIPQSEIQKIVHVAPWKRTQGSFVKNLIINTAMDGVGQVDVEPMFVKEGEVEELRELGYEIELVDDLYHIWFGNVNDNKI